MKKLLISSFVIMGMFLCAGFVSASTTDVLQPASGPTYDGLTVNGTGIFDSVRIGKQGVGGVTFFNGTIVNETTDEDGNSIPVTFGDDVRVDGRIWRGESAGTSDSMPLIVNDNMEVAGSLTANTLSTTGNITSTNFGNPNWVHDSGTVWPGNTKKIEIPHWTPFQIIMSSGQPDDYGLANVTLLENDWTVTAIASKYDGTGATSSSGNCDENTTNTLIENGPILGNEGGYIQCPGENSGDHNLVIGATNNGVEVHYKIIY